MNIFPIAEQIIQGGSIGKGCIFSHRGIQTLLLAIGAKGGGIKGNQGSTAGLGTGNAFDCRMNGFRHIHVAGDKALLLRSLHLVVMDIPCGTNCRVILSKLSIHSENQVAAFHDVIPAVCKGGVIVRVFGVPFVKVRE